MQFFRYIGWAEFLGVQNLHFDSRLFSLFLGVGSENLGMKVFVDIFGVTSKIEFFMFVVFFQLKSTSGIFRFMMKITLEHKCHKQMDILRYIYRNIIFGMLRFQVFFW